MNKFIFDVDGTLTPSRGNIDPVFKEFFTLFVNSNDTYLVTGSDYPKTLEQLGEDICNSVKRVYSCSGNDVYERSVHIRSNEWELPNDAREWLNNSLSKSKFVLRTGNHIEERKGCVNFSVVGRNATLKERQLYVKWDKEHNERQALSLEFNHAFKDIESRIGGETGLDIYPRGMDKRQIITDFSREDKLYFFGDKIEAGGNDYPLANVIKQRGAGLGINVRQWQDTFETLAYFQEAKIAA